MRLNHTKHTYMITSFQEVKNYYDQFDEWSTLDTPAGMIEHREVFNIIENLDIKLVTERC